MRDIQCTIIYYMSVCVYILYAHITITIIGKVAQKCTHTAPLTRFRLVRCTVLNLPKKKQSKKPFRFNLYFNDSNDRHRRRLTVQTAFLLRRRLGLIKIEFLIRPSMTNALQCIHYYNSAQAVQMYDKLKIAIYYDKTLISVTHNCLFYYYHTIGAIYI